MAAATRLEQAAANVGEDGWIGDVRKHKQLTTMVAQLRAELTRVRANQAAVLEVL